MWQEWFSYVLTPIQSAPFHFIFVALFSSGCAAALCIYTIYRRQLKWQRDTVERLEENIQERTIELQLALAELSEKNKALELQSTTDALTGINNRAYFDKKILAEIKRSRREQRPLALILLDIDHFKHINDQHGHVSGDYVIRGVAQRVQACLKRSTDHACRYGGEEFAVLLPNTDEEGAHSLSEQIRIAIASTPFETENGILAVQISAGAFSAIAEADMNEIDYVQAADTALYEAKRAGRNQTQMYRKQAPEPALMPEGNIHEPIK